ncbi:MAG: V-type ATPase subunit [Candidatus Omnitrophota bacterium]
MPGRKYLKLMRDLSKYSFANARIRAMLSALLPESFFFSLAEAKDIQEALALFKGTVYAGLQEGARISTAADLPVAERFIAAEESAAYKKVIFSLPAGREKDFLVLLRQKQEIEQLKTVLRIWHRKLPVAWEDYINKDESGSVLDFVGLMNAETIEEFILLLEDTPYKRALMKAREKFKREGKLFLLEVALDVDYYERVSEAIARLSGPDRRTASRIIGVEIDIENINLLLRSRKYYSQNMSEMLDWFIPGGLRLNKDNVRGVYTSDGITQVVNSLSFGPYAHIKGIFEENFFLIEGFLYGLLLREVRSALSGFPFTIGTAIGYLVSSRRQSGLLVSLLYAKAYGHSKDDVVQALNIGG